ncbi:MAG: tRNA preQ1(34) S-adenosylmethionine ribosyltransferase-isomerase QueA [Candidatus Magasanikbacteria bacterium]|nr:tRNA preQ1(34) S-adenosylmethionine ribosyltransferase-isomerase QueA [Candidatus Magasanikbacteria bacterium]
MLTSDFDYNLPKELIAQKPAEPRDHSRLMVIDRKNHAVEHCNFFDLPSFLKPGDLLVWNNSKVFKARFKGVVELDEEVSGIKSDDAGDIILNFPRVEIFLLRPMENPGVWKALAKPGRKLRLGMRVRFAEDFACEVLIKDADGTVLVQFNEDDLSVRNKANLYGEVPTPPYVKIDQPSGKDLSEQYQTVYAKVEGSVAAPTAGFHFTPELIEKLKEMKVEFAEITLHVGLGTFLPVKTKKIEEHKMHAEWVELTDKNADLINRAKAEGRRVIAVGTTTVRALEAVAEKTSEDRLRAFNGEVNIFILPGYKYKIIDALITNFHLPKSTLLMLVSAFIGDREFVLNCYAEAIKQNYRFYSFGDAMLIA